MHELSNNFAHFDVTNFAWSTLRNQLLTFLTFVHSRRAPYCLLRVPSISLDRNKGFEHWEMLSEEASRSLGNTW
jgi:hypothetical protein